MKSLFKRTRHTARWFIRRPNKLATLIALGSALIFAVVCLGYLFKTGHVPTFRQTALGSLPFIGLAGNVLGQDTKVIRVQNAAAAGVTVLTGSTIDLSDYDGVLFVYGVGALTAGQATSLQAGDGLQANGSDAALITAFGGGNAKTPNCLDADSNKLLILDVFRPLNRYVTPVLNRATQNAVVDFGIAILYNGKAKPAVVDTSVSQFLAVAATS